LIVGSSRIVGSMNCLAASFGTHVVDEVRVRGAVLGVEQVVDEQLRGDRVGRAGERRDRVVALDPALSGM
jgi:hypothetical protein